MTVADLVFLLGLAALCAGLTLYDPRIALVVAGVVLMALGVSGARTATREPKR